MKNCDVMLMSVLVGKIRNFRVPARAPWYDDAYRNGLPNMAGEYSSSSRKRQSVGPVSGTAFTNRTYASGTVGANSASSPDSSHATTPNTAENSATQRRALETIGALGR